MDEGTVHELGLLKLELSSKENPTAGRVQLTENAVLVGTSRMLAGNRALTCQVLVSSAESFRKLSVAAIVLLNGSTPVTEIWETTTDSPRAAARGSDPFVRLP